MGRLGWLAVLADNLVEGGVESVRRRLRAELRLRGRRAECGGGLPAGHVDVAEVGIWRQAAVQLGGQVARLRAQKVAAALPACQELLVLTLGHFERVDQDDLFTGHGAPPRWCRPTAG